MNIRVLGCHHTETQSSRLSTLLIDDHIALDAGAITTTLTIAEQAKVTDVVITHHHYDHTRDLLTLALGGANSGQTVSVHSTQDVLDHLQNHLLDGSFYPKFTENPNPPRLRLVPLQLEQPKKIGAVQFTPFAVEHSVPALGYLLSSDGGDDVFCTGDTGGGFAHILEKTKPTLLVTEVTFPNSQAEMAKLSKHMTPKLLEDELLQMVGTSSAPASILVIHMNSAAEPVIREELKLVEEKLGIPITAAEEGMVLTA